MTTAPSSRPDLVHNGEEITLRAAAIIIGCRAETLRKRLRGFRDLGVHKVDVADLKAASDEWRANNDHVARLTSKAKSPTVSRMNVRTSPTSPSAPAARSSLLHVMPMRITDLQFSRLSTARDRDGLAIQEHIRRAIDYYLGALERQAAPAAASAATPAVTRAPPRKSQPTRRRTR